MSEPTPTAELPGQIGRYTIERALGRGAMGAVFKAHDPAIGRDVAIKLVRTDLLDGVDREDYLARFRHEARAAGRCVHPNIVTIYDFALHGGNPFLVMEYVEGVSLADAIRHHRFPPEQAVAIVLDMLAALDCAHASGVVHRDIKPANVLLGAGGRVKVMDFGISRLENSSLTQDGSLIGTPSYMSPEQCRGRPVDPRSDLFSAGVVLFELLSGEKPFPGASFTEVVSRLLNDEAPDLGPRLGPGEAGVAAVVRRALAKEPDDRFPNATAMMAALEAAWSGQASQDQLASQDLTVVLPNPVPAAKAPPGDAFEEDVLDVLRSRLARHVGPIAGKLVSSAIRTAATLDDLCSSLAGKIPTEDAREEFLAEVRRGVPHHAGATRSGLAATQAGAPSAALPAPPGLPAELIERAQAELTHYMGPIARILVKRALPGSVTAAELWEKLAAHIATPAERRAFEAKRPSG